LVTVFWGSPVELPLLPPRPTVPATTDAGVPTGLFPSVPREGTGREAPPVARPFLPGLAVGGLLLWSLGVGWWGSRLCWAWHGARQLRKGGEPVGDGWAEACCSELCQRLGLARPPHLLVAVGTVSPSLIGVLHPAIVLPASLLRGSPSARVRLVLAHELAHLKRHDLIWNWLPTLAYGLFFFHPLVWLAGRGWRLTQESACDEVAVRATGAEVATYGRMLLELAVRGPAKPSWGLAAVGIGESYASLKGRLIAMKYFGPVSRRRRLLMGIGVALLGAAGVVPWRVTAQQAAPGAGHVTYDGKPLSSWVKALKSPEIAEREKAHEVFNRVGPEAKAEVPLLIQTLKDEDNWVRRYAAVALGQIGPEAKIAVPELIKMLKDRDAGVRWQAAYALGGVGPGAKAAVPDLIQALRDADHVVRFNAAKGLGRIGPEARAAVPELIEMLKEKNEVVRGHAAIALGQIGPEARAAVPALKEMLKDENRSIRSLAAEALQEIDPEAIDQSR